MTMLSKELVLYERDENNELIPQETPLLLSKKDEKDYPELKGMKIGIIPLKRGEIKKLFGLDGKDTDAAPETDRDTDGEIIVKHCKSPAFTLEELSYAKPVIVRSIVRTIFNESGIMLDENTGQKRFEDNDEFGKNS